MDKSTNINPYLNPDGSPQLRRSIVAFIDILGYKELIRRESDSLGNLIKIRNAFQNAFHSLDPDFGTKNISRRFWMTKTFTDHIVIGQPINLKDGSPELGMVLGRVGEFQLQMTLSGFFVRGAVTVNEIFMDEDIVFGPALIEAYDAEQKIARDPRIVIACPLNQMEYLDQRKHLTKHFSHHHDILLKDRDSQLFLNYLQAVVEFEPDMGYPSTKYLETHKDYICKRLKEFKNVPAIWSKYFWCAAYHNFFCDVRSDFNDFKIDLQTIAPQPQRIISIKD